MSHRIGFGVVRDRNGKPRIDGAPKDMHPGIIVLLTPQERAELGLWDGPLARDAQGTKRLEKTETGYRALDALVALSEIYDGKVYRRLKQRVDVPAGGAIIVEKMEQ